MGNSVTPRAASGSAVRFGVLSLLAVDGVLSALAGCLLLPCYIGSVPFPVSGLLSGLLNAALVWAAGQWTGSPRAAALPLWTWLLTVAVFSMGGPGDDIILSGRGLMAYAAPLVMVLGVTPPAWVLWRRGRVTESVAAEAAEVAAAGTARTRRG